MATTGQWRKAMRVQGTREEQIDKVVETAEAPPTDLITLETASERHEIPYGTLLRWVNNGTLAERGRERFSARGGGKLLVSDADVVELKDHRPKKGRPAKNPINGVEK